MQIPVINKKSIDGDKNYKPPSAFPIGPHFKKYSKNPILTPNPDNEFESAYIYNASAIVVDDRVFLLYRAQNEAKTSSVGLAWSDDGYKFKRYHKPIIYPTEPWENGGGCEDPRITRDPESKLFIVTYTSYDRYRARLCVAVSEDLFHWVKYPPIILNDSDWHDLPIVGVNNDVVIREGWLKLGAVFTERHPATGKYYMIWGDCAFHLAESDDLKHWKLTNNDWRSNIFTKGIFDWQDKLIEPGPAPIKLQYKDGDKERNHYVLFYNSATLGLGGLPEGTYSILQMLIDYDNIKGGPIARLEKPIIIPDQDNERNGQVDKVVFTEGIVQFKGKWFLYFGQGDSELGVATCDV